MRTPQERIILHFLDKLGICSISQSDGSNVLAFPATQTGHVCLTGIGNTLSLTLIIPAHESPLAAIAVDFSGNLLATASVKGTLIRVFDAKSGRLLCELRRGAERAEIYSLEFSLDGSKLCAASDKGTVHIFNLESPESTPSEQNFAAEFATCTDEGQNKQSR